MPLAQAQVNFNTHCRGPGTWPRHLAQALGPGTRPRHVAQARGPGTQGLRQVQAQAQARRAVAACALFRPHAGRCTAGARWGWCRPCGDGGVGAGLRRVVTVGYVSADLKEHPVGLLFQVGRGGGG
jgi:hypothetical protein